MTLADIIRRIGEVASEQPAISSVLDGDIYDLNQEKSIRYGAFALSQTSHRFTPGAEMVEYGFLFYYADRLNNGQSNRIDIQSVGVQVLTNIINTLYAEGLATGQVVIRPFEQRFSDECAGAYAELTISAPRTTGCEEIY